MIIQILARVQRVSRNPHFWILTAGFILGIFFHYYPIWRELLPGAFFGLSRHAIIRIGFLLLTIYAAIIFGIIGGITSLIVAFAIMLPRAVFISPNRTDAILEISGIVIIGALVTLWFHRQQRVKEQHQQVILSLESAKREIQLNVERLATLNTISQIVCQFMELEHVLNSALIKIVQVMGVDIALIYVLNDDVQELELKAYHGVTKKFIDKFSRIKVGVGLIGRVAESGEPLVIKDTSYESQFTKETMTLDNSQTQLIVPLKFKGSVVGAFCAGTPQLKEFSSDEVDMLNTIGNEIGIAIENARLYQDQLTMAEQLRQSERKYRELFEKANDGIWVHDLDGNMATANEATARLTGYDLKELLKMNVKSFLSDQSLDLAREIRKNLLKGELIAQPYEQQILRRDGTKASLMLTTSLITRDGQPEAFQHIARDVTEEKMMHENLQFYVQQITRAQEEERKRIARELHDDTTQALVVLSRQLDSLISTNQSSTQDTTSLEKLHKQVDKILDGVRRFSQDLRPSILDDLGLLAVLEWLAADLIDHFGISIGMAVQGSERRFSPEAELLLFRIAQEALRNVWRHSGAKRAWITLKFGRNKTTLTIVDNGKGFELPKRLGDLASVGKLGLAGMEERAKLLGGKLTIRSELDKGTTITAEMPYNP